MQAARVDPVIVLVFADRVVGSLPVLRGPFWGGVLAIVCDRFDLLLCNLFSGLPRDALIVAPNPFEFWYLAVACTWRDRPAFAWTPGRSAVALLALGAAEEVQEWAPHVGRLFDGFSFLEALDAIRRAVLSPFGGG